MQAMTIIGVSHGKELTKNYDRKVYIRRNNYEKMKKPPQMGGMSVDAKIHIDKDVSNSVPDGKGTEKLYSQLSCFRPSALFMGKFNFVRNTVIINVR